MHITSRSIWPFSARKHFSLTSQAVGWLALGGTILAGSTYNAFAKPLTSVLSPLSLLFLSEFLTLIFVVLTFGLLPTASKLKNLKRTKRFPLALLAICNGIVAPLLILTGLETTTAVNATLF